MRLFHQPLAILLALAAGIGWTAPIGPAEPDTGAAGSASAFGASSDTPAAPVAGALGSATTRTTSDRASGQDSIELLLELSGKPSTSPAGEAAPAQPRLSPEAARIAAKALGLPAPGAGSALDTTQPTAGAKPGDAAWVPPKPLALSNPFAGSGLDGASPDRRGAAGPDVPPHRYDDDSLRWLIPPSLVRFVKENREMVIGGSVALLLVLWLATAVGGRRK